MIGTTISHYRILEELGRGGMGVVYKAEDTKLNRIVALKFLPKQHSAGEAEQARFLQEAKTASSLNHPNVCTIYGIDEHDGEQFIEMEFIDGMSLRRKVVERGSVSAHGQILEVVTHAIQIGEALAEAHANGIIHRDIKADNIMVNGKNQIKVMDFGLAKLKGSLRLTKTFTTVGTLGYMSPEQIQGVDADQRSDIFSFGVVLYEMLTARLPFRGEHEAAMMYSIVHEEPQAFSKFGVDVPPELRQVVLRALMKTPDDRYQTATEMVSDLRAILTPQSIGAPKKSTLRQTLRKRASPLLSRTGIAAAVGVLCILSYLLLVREPDPPSNSAQGKKSFTVMYFENVPDPADKDHTAEMLSNLLVTSLSQIGDLTVVSRSRLYEIQKELGDDSPAGINPQLATKIAQHAGIATMLLGSVVQVRPSLSVTMHLVDVKTGTILNSQRVTDFPPGRIFALVDSMSSLVRGALNVSDLLPEEAKPLSALTTSSPEAYRSYLAGVELSKKLYTQEAKAAFRKATELDSTFAMAHFALRDFPRAYKYMDRATEKERKLIEAVYAYNVEHNTEKSVRILEELLSKHPHEQDVYHSLQSYYVELAQFEKAIHTNQRAAKMDSLSVDPWNNLAYLYADQARRAEALDAADHYIMLAPAEPNPYDTKGDVYAKFGEADSAIAWYRKALEFRPDFYTTAEKIGIIDILKGRYSEARENFQMYGMSQELEKRSWAKIDLVHILLRQGKLGEAERALLTLVAEHRPKKLHAHLLTEYSLLSHIARERDDTASILKYATLYAAESVNDTNSLLRGIDWLARAYAFSGDTGRARSRVEASRKHLRERSPAGQLSLYKTEAFALFESANFVDALSAFQEVFAREPIGLRHYLPYAVSLFNVGRTTEAIDRLLRKPLYIPESIPDRLDWSISDATSLYWIGRMYEKIGENQKSAEAYKLFLHTWKNADQDLAKVMDARARLNGIQPL